MDEEMRLVTLANYSPSSAFEQPFDD